MFKFLFGGLQLEDEPHDSYDFARLNSSLADCNPPQMDCYYIEETGLNSSLADCNSVPVSPFEVGNIV